MVSLTGLDRRHRRRLTEADAVAVIGLGRFGTAVALELMESGTEVLGIDASEDIVQNLNGRLTTVVRADSTREEALQQLGVDEFDRVVVAIGSDIQSSILTCSILRAFDIPSIWAKAVGESHARILDQLGVNHVVQPEKEMGSRVAHLVRGVMLDYIELDKDYALVKTAPSEDLIGKTLAECRLPQRYGVSVTSIKGGDGRWRSVDDDTVLHEGDTILVAGPIRQAERFSLMG